MANIIDLIGQRFGRLEVIGPGERKGKWSFKYWLCQCDCGNTKSVASTSLRSGATKSCGCLKRELNSARLRGDANPNRLPPTEAAFNSLIAKYKQSAAQRGLLWELTLEECHDLFQCDCHYCGKPPSQIARSKRPEPFVYNGLDRLDSALGYSLENVVPSCKQCNYAKLTYTPEEFRGWIRRVFQHMVESPSSSVACPFVWVPSCNL